MTAGDWLACGGISLFVSLCSSIGYSYAMGEGWPYFSWPQMIALAVLLTFPIMVLLILLSVAFGRLARARAEGESNTPRGRILERITPTWSKRSIALFSLVMLVLWAPWILTMVPPALNNDTFYQIYQVYPEHHPLRLIPFLGVETGSGHNVEVDAWLVDHHPVLTTLIFGAFGYVSDLLTGNWLAGMIVYSALQGIAYACTYTASVAYLRRVRCPLVVVFSLYAFYAIMPFIPTWAFSMIKDAIFGLFAVPYFLMLFEGFRSDGDFFLRRRNVVLFAVIGILVCLTRKQGIFIVVPTALVAALVFFRKARREGVGKPSRNGAFRAFLSQGLICLVLMAIVLPCVVFPLAHIVPGGKQEVLGTLFQQTARYLVDHPDDVTSEEETAIRGVLDFEELAESYLPITQDKVKWKFYIEADSDRIAEYLKAYVQMGLRHPDSYIGAIMGIAGYYFAPTTYIYWSSYQPQAVPEGEGVHYFAPPVDALKDYSNFMDGAYLGIARIYGLNTPLLMVLYCLWIPAAMLYIVMRKRLRCKTILLPFGIILLTFFVVAPVYDPRYIVVSFETAPLLFGYIVAIIRTKEKSMAPMHSIAEEPTQSLAATEVQTQHA